MRAEPEGSLAPPALLEACPQIIALHTTCCAHLPRTVNNPTTGVAWYHTGTSARRSSLPPPRPPTGDGCRIPRHHSAVSAALGAGAYGPPPPVPAAFGRQDLADYSLWLPASSGFTFCDTWCAERLASQPGLCTSPVSGAPRPALILVPLSAPGVPRDWSYHSVPELGGGLGSKHISVFSLRTVGVTTTKMSPEGLFCVSSNPTAVPRLFHIVYLYLYSYHAIFIFILHSPLSNPPSARLDSRPRPLGRSPRVA